jgi:hypothetical protein
LSSWSGLPPPSLSAGADSTANRPKRFYFLRLSNTYPYSTFRFGLPMASSLNRYGRGNIAVDRLETDLAQIKGVAIIAKTA